LIGEQFARLRNRKMPLAGRREAASSPYCHSLMTWVLNAHYGTERNEGMKMPSGIRAALGLLAALTFAGAAEAAPAWQDSFESRLAALALLQSLNADLLSHDSATLILDRWCAAHQLASPARIVAERVHDVDKAPTGEQRQLLRVSATEPIRYRRVKLTCGSHVLSEADNWYVPARLTPAMNQVL